MAKSKKNSNSPQKVQLSPQKYIITKSRSLPWGKCYISDSWSIMGMASIIMTRVMPSGKLIVGIYLVDTFCMGLKNTDMRFAIDESEFEALKQQIFEAHQSDPEEVTPLLLQNIIYGAIEYAEDLGFQPNRDFNITEYILEPADKIGFIDIEFGKDGKPFYIQGPHDNVAVILKKLEKRVGIGGFDFLSRADQLSSSLFSNNDELE